jgi:hypothetical protein
VDAKTSLKVLTRTAPVVDSSFFATASTQGITNPGASPAIRRMTMPRRRTPMYDFHAADVRRITRDQTDLLAWQMERAEDTFHGEAQADGSRSSRYSAFDDQ